MAASTTSLNRTQSLFRFTALLVALLATGCDEATNKPTPQACPMILSDVETRSFQRAVSAAVEKDPSLTELQGFVKEYRTQLDAVGNKAPGVYDWQNAGWTRVADAVAVEHRFTDGSRVLKYQPDPWTYHLWVTLPSNLTLHEFVYQKPDEAEEVRIDLHPWPWLSEFRFAGQETSGNFQEKLFTTAPFGHFVRRHGGARFGCTPEPALDFDDINEALELRLPGQELVVQKKTSSTCSTEKFSGFVQVNGVVRIQTDVPECAKSIDPLFAFMPSLGELTILPQLPGLHICFGDGGPGLCP